ncbi:MAG: PfkB family carbohydrate kinase [Actinomycetes bacterium]
MTAGRVLVLGSVNVDLVLRVSRLPMAGETLAATGLTRRPGGKGANQALAAARAGATTRLIGCVGADADGQAYLEALTARGVDTAGVRVSQEQPTGMAVVTVDDAGANTIVVLPGANAEVDVEQVRAGLADARPGDMLLTCLEVPVPVVAEAVRLAGTRGVGVVLNPSPMVVVPRWVWAGCSVVVVNESERALLAAAGLNWGVPVEGTAGGPAGGAAGTAGPAGPSLVTSLGSAGARWEDPGGTRQVAAPTVPAVDTTGAGDALAGTLAAGLAGRLDPDLVLARAVAAGSQAVTWVGAQDWVLATD